MEANIETGSKDIPESVLNVPDTGDSTIRVMEKSNETLEESENMPVAENNEVNHISVILLIYNFRTINTIAITGPSSYRLSIFRSLSF